MESRMGYLRSRLALVTVAAVALTGAMGVMAASSTARAAIDFTVIDPQLKELEFGKGFEAIAAWIGKRLDRTYLPKIAAASDANERARVRARRDQEIAQMRNNEAVFDGRETGFEGSIIASEYGVGTNETMYSYKEGAATHFFFMHEGKLWKYARVMGAESLFQARLASFQNGFGEPAKTREETDRRGGTKVMAATWQKGAFDVHLSDRRMVYGSDLLVIEDRAVAGKLADLRGVKRQGLGGVSESLESFLLDDVDTYGKPQKDAEDKGGKKPNTRSPRSPKSR